MRTLIAALLVAVGAGLILYGLGSALMGLIGLYQGAMTDPLADPKGGETGVSRAMLTSAAIGAVGVAPFVVGLVMLKVGIFRALKKR